MPLRYGSHACCIVLSDSTHTRDIVALRNDPSVNRFIHHERLTCEDHEKWLMREAERRDSLNFVALVNGRFSGTASLYDIEPLGKCQYGRVVMPNDGRRIFAVAVEFLCLSFAFEVIEVQEVYCRVIRENQDVYRFHLRNGWQPDSRYDGQLRIGTEEFSELGMKMSVVDWKCALERYRSLLHRLHTPATVTTFTTNANY
jgi:RimJ/RimL family protein N-acetyltransferase